MQYFSEFAHSPEQIGIYHDRFGFLSCYLYANSPLIVTTQRSQEKAILANFKENNLESLPFYDPISKLDNKLDIAVVKIPKSLDLFQLFLEHIVQNSNEDLKVVTGFMTRHFTPKLLEIASHYFEKVEQSRAFKKSRLLILSDKKKTPVKELVNTLGYKDRIYKQYWGVFSAGHIDYATQFFLEHLQLDGSEKQILDLASGNGVIGLEISKQLPPTDVYLMDDSYLAVASAKLNGTGQHIHHYYNNDLSIFEPLSFDLIVSNPPFHFEYEINIQVPIHLFNECYRCLKVGGSLQLVANRHLNYKVHLILIFSQVEVIAEHEKFVVYRCLKLN